MPNRPLTDVDTLAALLLQLGDSIRLGQTGICITIAPVPMHTPDAHERCYSVDLTDAAVAQLIARLSSAPTTRTEAA